MLLLPFCLGGAYLIVRRLLRGVACPGQAAVWLAASAALGLLVAGLLAERPGNLRLFPPGGWPALGIALALAAGAASTPVRRWSDHHGFLPWTLSGLTAALLLFGALSFSVYGEEHIRNAPTFWRSFNAFFHSVVQVFLGKELTVDFVNQYGLYPHFLEPIFRIVGLSLYSFTILMGLLSSLALACLYLFLARETRSPRRLPRHGRRVRRFLRLLQGVGAAGPLLPVPPLRTIFPAVLVLAAGSFAHRPTRWMPAAFGALGAAASLWSPDVGIVVFASGLLLLGYDALARRQLRDVPVRLLQAVAAAIGFIALFALFLRLRFGAFPDFARVLLYSKIYYVYGIHMLPMPRFGLWVPVLAVYALGLLRSIIALVDGEDRPRDRIHFLLAVLGLGLFSYFQGRSAFGNLLLASWPAILLLSLFTEELARTATSRRQIAERVLHVTLLALLFFPVPVIARITPGWLRYVAEKIETSRRGDVSDVLRDSRFLQEQLRPGEEVHIMSYQSGIFHLATRTTNPLNIPGATELCFREDFEKELAYVFGRKGKSVVDKTIVSDRFVSRVRSFYPNRLESPSGNLILLVP